MKKLFLFRWNQSLIFFIVTVLFCCSEDNLEIVQNCRIKELLMANEYSYSFSYYNDGRLKSITSPDYSSLFEYSNEKLTKVNIVNNEIVETVTLLYPSDTVVIWGGTFYSQGTYREYTLHHHENKVDSLIIIYPEILAKQSYSKHMLTVEYENNNVMKMSYKGKGYELIYKDFQYDQQVNSFSMLTSSSGGIPIACFIPGFDFQNLRAENLSENNPTRYTEEFVSNPEGDPTFSEMSREYEYQYSENGKYPIMFNQDFMGSPFGVDNYLIYENCEMM